LLTLLKTYNSFSKFKKEVKEMNYVLILINLNANVLDSTSFLPVIAE